MTEIPEIVDVYGRLSFWYNETRKAEKLNNMEAFREAARKWQACQDELAKVCKEKNYKLYMDIR